MIREPLRRGIALLLSYLLTVSLSGCHQEIPCRIHRYRASRPESSAGSNADSSHPPKPQPLRVIWFCLKVPEVHRWKASLSSLAIRFKSLRPVKEGFRFTGWTLSGNPYDFHTPVGSDLLLIAGGTVGSADDFHSVLQQRRRHQASLCGSKPRIQRQSAS